MLSSEQKKLIDKLSKIDNIDGKVRSLLDKTNRNIREIKDINHAVDKIIEEKTTGFPWLADAIAQYYEMRDFSIAEFLEKKLRPAISSAERVSEIAREKRIIEKKFRITRNLITQTDRF